MSDDRPGDPMAPFKSGVPGVFSAEGNSHHSELNGRVRKYGHRIHGINKNIIGSLGDQL
jgi:hypothetical protein